MFEEANSGYVVNLCLVLDKCQTFTRSLWNKSNLDQLSSQSLLLLVACVDEKKQSNRLLVTIRNGLDIFMVLRNTRIFRHGDRVDNFISMLITYFFLLPRPQVSFQTSADPPSVQKIKIFMIVVVEYFQPQSNPTRELKQ